MRNLIFTALVLFSSACQKAENYPKYRKGECVTAKIDYFESSVCKEAVFTITGLCRNCFPAQGFSLNARHGYIGTADKASQKAGCTKEHRFRQSDILDQVTCPK
jgi:hypothetical protein